LEEVSTIENSIDRTQGPSKPGKTYTRFKFEGQFVKGYDAFNHAASFGLDLYWRWKTSRLLKRDLAALPQPLRILDLACGTGDMARSVAKVNRDSRVIGTDPSMSMISRGREKLESMLGQITLLRAVSDLPFRNQTFSGITCAFGMRNFAHLADDLLEAHRLLQSGGRIYVLDFFTPGNKFSETLLKLYNYLVFPFLGFLLTGKIGPYRYLFSSIFAFKSAPDFSIMLAQAGFVDIYVKRFFFGLVHLVSGRRP
jgi:demethylmenaquinone methyltransferase/2-methoxy-6-polyprenyl-1,4-benzoquinol methylase